MGDVLSPALTYTLNISPQHILGFPTQTLAVRGLGERTPFPARFSLASPIQFQPTASFVCARVHCHLQEHGARSRILRAKGAHFSSRHLWWSHSLLTRREGPCPEEGQTRTAKEGCVRAQRASCRSPCCPRLRTQSPVPPSCSVTLLECTPVCQIKCCSVQSNFLLIQTRK